MRELLPKAHNNMPALPFCTLYFESKVRRGCLLKYSTIRSPPLIQYGAMHEDNNLYMMTAMALWKNDTTAGGVRQEISMQCLL